MIAKDEFLKKYNISEDQFKNADISWEDLCDIYKDFGDNKKKEKRMLQEDLAGEIARKGMQLIRGGNIRDHKLCNSSRIHTGEVEKKEYQNYRDFLPSKNFYMVYELTGSHE